MKGKRAALAALLPLLLWTSAATQVAAQLRVGVAVDVPNAQPQVPVVGMGGINGSPTALPLNPSLSGSLTPTLSAPAVSLNTPALLSVPQANALAAETKGTKSLTPAVAAALSVSIHAAPSKSDEVRAEAAKAVAAWKAARAEAAGAQTPVTPEATAANLDALFDGSLPTSKRVLDRADSLGLSAGALGLAISESKSVSEAADRLSNLGVLGPKEAVVARAEVDEFRFLLTRVWRAAAPELPSPYAVDSSWSVPALKVERDGVVYFVHGVAHGQGAPPRRGAVLKLARESVASGDALYSEQNLPAYYGYAAGRETLDHKAPAGYPVTVVNAAPGFTAASLKIKRAIDWAVSPGTAVAAAVWTALHAASPFGWIALAAALLLAFYTLTGGLPLLRMKRRRRAAEARAAGLADMAEQYADEAKNFFVAKPDLEVLRGLELPQPLGGIEGDPYSVRSRAIADAVAADAAAKGAKAVHLVVGHLHAHEVAWRLANGPRPKTQNS